MTRSTTPSRLRLAAFGMLACTSLTMLTGCPTLLCPNCSIKAAAFAVPPTPRGAKIVEVAVNAKASFSGHCPEPPGKSSCLVDRTFVSNSTVPGDHVVTFEGWPFGADDTVEVEAVVVQLYRGATVTTTIDPSKIDLVVVEEGDYY